MHLNVGWMIVLKGFQESTIAIFAAGVYLFMFDLAM